MTRPMRTVLWLVALASGVGVMIFAGATRQPPARDLGQASSVASAPAPSRPPDIAAAGAVAPREVPQTEFTRHRATLEAMARAGSAEAAQRLGDVLRACGPESDMPLAVAIHRQVSGSTHGTRRRQAAPAAPALDAAFRVDLGAYGVLPPNTFLLPDELKRVSLCDGVREYTEADRIAAYDWLVLAANLGSPRAMAMRFDIEFEHIGDDAASRIDQASRLIALRPRASAMLQRAADTGEPQALARMARAHASGDLATRDDLLADAYALAADVTAERAGESGTQALQRLRAASDAERLARVEQAADDILARCCAPEAP